MNGRHLKKKDSKNLRDECFLFHYMQLLPQGRKETMKGLTQKASVKITCSFCFFIFLRILRDFFLLLKKFASFDREGNSGKKFESNFALSRKNSCCRALDIESWIFDAAAAIFSYIVIIFQCKVFYSIFVSTFPEKRQATTEVISAFNNPNARHRK